MGEAQQTAPQPPPRKQEVVYAGSSSLKKRRRRAILVLLLLMAAAAIQVGWETKKSWVWVDNTLHFFAQDKTKKIDYNNGSDVFNASDLIVNQTTSGLQGFMHGQFRQQQQQQDNNDTMMNVSSQDSSSLHQHSSPLGSSDKSSNKSSNNINNSSNFNQTVISNLTLQQQTEISLLPASDNNNINNTQLPSNLQQDNNNKESRNDINHTDNNESHHHNQSHPDQQLLIHGTASTTPTTFGNSDNKNDTTFVLENHPLPNTTATPLQQLAANDSNHTNVTTLAFPLSSSQETTATALSMVPITAKWLLTNQTTPNNTHANNINNSSAFVVHTKGVLDLLPWEIQSIREYQNITDAQGIKLLGTCHPPDDNVQATCCLGSFSGGGGVTRSWAHHCFKDEATYDRVANVVLQELQRTDHMVDEDCDLCRVVDLINKFDLRFAISGDSMMSQNVDGFFCELTRRGYRVTRVNTTLINPGTMVGLKEILTHEIIGPAHWQTPTSLQFIFQYRPNITEIEEIVGSYDVLFMNFGLHWSYIDYGGYGRDMAGYENTMTKVLNATLRHGNITLLLHRETSAQHHNFTAGEWATERTKCVPLNFQNHSDIIGWRERVVRAAAKEVGYKVVVADETLASAGKPVAGQNELVILPFFNLTASMFYLHPDECTHYCSTPYLWMPIWRSLRLAMDRQWHLLS